MILCSVVCKQADCNSWSICRFIQLSGVRSASPVNTCLHHTRTKRSWIQTFSQSCTVVSLDVTCRESWITVIPHSFPLISAPLIKTWPNHLKICYYSLHQTYIYTEFQTAEGRTTREWGRLKCLSHMHSWNKSIERHQGLTFSRVSAGHAREEMERARSSTNWTVTGSDWETVVHMHAALSVIHAAARRSVCVRA